jgi:hypothetical protein
MASRDDEQIAALQREVIGASLDTCRLRRVLAGGSGIGLLVLTAVASAYTWVRGPDALLGLACSLLFLAGPLGVIGYCVILPLAHRYQAAHERRLMEKLVALPPETRESVLLPLHPAGGDTAAMVERLICELRSQPAELTPATAPDGRGDETSPVDPEP